MSVNKVILVGNLGSDPEIKEFSNGGKVANFSLATTQSWKDRNSGERQTKTEWHRISVFTPGLIGVIQNYVKKGSKVYIEGALQTREWEANGERKFATEVVLQGFNSTLVMLDSRGENSGGGSSFGGGNSFGNSNNSSSFGNNNKSQSFGNNNQSNNNVGDMLDDEIPF